MNQTIIALLCTTGITLAASPFIAGHAEDMTIEIQGGNVVVKNVPGLSPATGNTVGVTTNGGMVTPPGNSGISVNGVTAQAIGKGNSASVNTGGMGDGVQSQGVTVINGEVWIDGEKVPPTATHFTSKAGHSYSIDRSSGGARVKAD